VAEGWMDEDPTLNSPSYRFSLNICSGLGSFRSDGFLPHRRRFPCATGFPHVVETVPVPLSLNDQFLPHKVTASGGVYTARLVCPVS
jgi:hypothetical protein